MALPVVGSTQYVRWLAGYTRESLFTASRMGIGNHTWRSPLQDEGQNSHRSQRRLERSASQVGATMELHDPYHQLGLPAIK